FSQIVHRFGHLYQVEAISVAYHRNNQISCGQCCSHTNIDVALFNNLSSRDLDINHRIVAYCLGNGFYKYWRKGNFCAFLPSEVRFYTVSPLHNIGHVCLDKRAYMRRGLDASYHMFRDQLAHPVHFDNLVTSAKRRGSNLLLLLLLLLLVDWMRTCL